MKIYIFPQFEFLKTNWNKISQMSLYLGKYLQQVKMGMEL